MGLLDSLLSVVAVGYGSTHALEHPIGPALDSLLTRSGGISGLEELFNRHGLGGVFSSWVSMGGNHPVSSMQMHQVLGSSRIHALAHDLGMDPTKAAGFLAEYLPDIVDRLTPNGYIEENQPSEYQISSLLPSLLAGLGV